MITSMYNINLPVNILGAYPIGQIPEYTLCFNLACPPGYTICTNSSHYSQIVTVDGGDRRRERERQRQRGVQRGNRECVSERDTANYTLSDRVLSSSDIEGIYIYISIDNIYYAHA